MSFDIEAAADQIAKRLREEFEEINYPTFAPLKGITPEKQHENDAAYDLISCERDNIRIEPYQAQLVRTGTFAAIPAEHVGLVCSRSGMALNHGVFVLNAPGVIDPSYRGEIGVILMNLTAKDYIVQPGDRVAQLLVLKTGNVRFFNNAAVFDAYSTERGEDGFGSTGRQ